MRIQSSTQLKEVRIAEAKVDHAARKPPLATDRNGSRVLTRGSLAQARAAIAADRWRQIDAGLSAKQIRSENIPVSHGDFFTLGAAIMTLGALDGSHDAYSQHNK